MTPKNTVPPERQASALGAWLEAPAGHSMPPDLDDDVVEALYALRPDLAPAPRVTAEDILGLVTSGPLAASPGAARPSSAAGAEIVPFPSARGGRAETSSSESAETAARPRWSRWLGGGVGIAIAAAATLLLVALPSGQRALDAAPSPASAPSPVAAPASQPMGDLGPSTPADALRTAPAADLASRSAEAAKPVADPSVLQMQDGAVYRRQTSMIPEVTEQRPTPAQESPTPAEASPAGDAVGDAAGEAAAETPVAGPQVAVQLDEVEDDREAKAVTTSMDQARERALSKVGGTGWRKGVDPQVLARIDQAVADAAGLRQAGNLRGAADRLAPFVAPPARAGQFVAQIAATDYLAAGDAQAALGIAQRGLGLDTHKSSEWIALNVAYGDALRATGDLKNAEAAYELAR